MMNNIRINLSVLFVLIIILLGCLDSSANDNNEKMNNTSGEILEAFQVFNYEGVEFLVPAKWEKSIFYIDSIKAHRFRSTDEYLQDGVFRPIFSLEKYNYEYDLESFVDNYLQILNVDYEQFTITMRNVLLLDDSFEKVIGVKATFNIDTNTLGSFLIFYIKNQNIYLFNGLYLHNRKTQGSKVAAVFNEVIGSAKFTGLWGPGDTIRSR